MKKKAVKSTLSLLLAGAMALSLTACGSTAPEAEKAPSSEKTEETKETTPDAEAATGTEAAALDHSEHVDLTMLLLGDGNSEEKEAEVEAAINAILEPKFNTSLHFTTVSLTDHAQKVNLMLASGDELDLFECYGSYSNFYANGYLMDITDYSQYYPNISEIIGNYMDSGKINGRQYGLPSSKDLAGATAVMFRTDVLNDIGVDPDSIQSLDDMHDMLVKIKEKYPDLVPWMGGAHLSVMWIPGNIEKQCWFDGLGDDFAVLMDPTESTTVEDFYETESFRKICEYAWQWKKEGLIDWDTLTYPNELTRAGRSAGFFYSGAPKSEAEASLAAGYPMSEVEMLPKAHALLTTANSFSWCVNSNCKYPERALEVLDYLYTDKEIANLMAWGIEGEDYQKISDEGVGVIDYVDGQDAGNVSYFQLAQYSFPNTFLQYVMNGTDPYLWDKVDAWNKEADVSLALGFSFDNSKVTTEIAAVTNVINEYKGGLISGQMDPSTELPAFIDALKAAGIDKIIAEKQAQLDAWLETKQ